MIIYFWGFTYLGGTRILVALNSNLDALGGGNCLIHGNLRVPPPMPTPPPGNKALLAGLIRGGFFLIPQNKALAISWGGNVAWGFPLRSPSSPSNQPKELFEDTVETITLPLQWTWATLTAVLTQKKPLKTGWNLWIRSDPLLGMHLNWHTLGAICIFLGGTTGSIGFEEVVFFFLLGEVGRDIELEVVIS